MLGDAPVAATDVPEVLHKGTAKILGEAPAFLAYHFEIDPNYTNILQRGYKVDPIMRQA